MSQAPSAAPEVTAVIPCFNQGQYVAECLDSLRAQTMVRWRAILLDDASTDGVSPDLCRKQADERVRVICLEQNHGRSLVRNVGIEAATTEAIFSLDADDCLAPEHFATTVPLLLADPAVGVVYSDYQRFGVRTGLLRGAPFDLRTMYLRQYIWAGSLFRRSAWAKTIGYSDDFRDGNEDYDFFLRIVEAGYRGVYVPKPLFRYRVHATSWSTTQSADDDRVFRSYQRIHEQHRAGFEAQGTSDAFMARIHATESRRLFRVGDVAGAGRMLSLARDHTPDDWRLRFQALRQALPAPRPAQIRAQAPDEAGQGDGVTVPPHGHFIWLGPRLSAMAWLSIRSALDRGGLARIILHHTDAALADDPQVAALRRLPAFELRPCEPGPLFDAATAAPLSVEEMARLRALYGMLSKPASRANIIRLLVLLREGGLYLDTDIVVLRDLRPLCDQPGFAGLERVCLPASVLASRNPLVWARAGTVMAARDLLSRVPGGLAPWRRVEGACHLAANNAVVAAAPGNRVLVASLRRAAAMSTADATRMYALGPKLLEHVTGNRSSGDFRLYPPEAFYPYPPEICWHLFRLDNPATPETAFDEATWLVHLYDSVVKRRNGRPIDVAFLRERRRRSLFGRMVEPWLDELFACSRAHD